MSRATIPIAASRPGTGRGYLANGVEPEDAFADREAVDSLRPGSLPSSPPALRRAGSGVPELLSATARELVELLEGDACLVSRAIGQVLIEVASYSRSGQAPDLDHGYLIDAYPLTEEVIVHSAPRLVSLHDRSPDAAEAALLRKLGFDALMMLPLR